MVLLVGCQDDKQKPAIFLSGSTMGTTYHITLVDAPSALIQSAAQDSIDRLLAQLNQQMSTYIDDSEIRAFNRLAEHQWQTISLEFMEVIELSQHISSLTDGQFDITIGPLVELWGFGKQTITHRPSDIAIADAKARVGWRKLQIDKPQLAISKQAPLWLDVSAVAKGYAVDKIAEWITSKGIQNFLVEIGGEMRLGGTNRQQQPWRIGIETPSLLQKKAQQLILLSNKAIATSGDYRNFFEEDGQRFSHTIDPLSGQPVKHNIASVSVIAETAAEADAWATALNVLGEEQALVVAEAQQLAAYFILYDNESKTANYKIVMTEAFKPYIH